MRSVELTNMDKARSLYLELLRIVAAFYVFIYHFGSEPIEGKPFFSPVGSKVSLYINWYGAHFFVIVFFVLSGFLITMSAHKKGMTFSKFLIARLGRLYSVVIPALVFTYLVAGVLIHAGYKLENDDNLVARFFLNLFFLTQSWSLCAMPPADGPFWSISYEFMYYLIAGACLLIPKPYKLVSIIIFILIAGLKVLLLFPAWLAGSLLFYLTKKSLIFNQPVSFIVFIVTLCLMIYTFVNPYYFPFLEQNSNNKIGSYTLFFSWNYKADSIFSILVTLNIYSFFGVSKKIIKYLESKVTDTFLSFIYKAGNCTFTLYLFHLPVMFFLAAMFPYDKQNSGHNAILICSTLIIVYFIARITEWRLLFWRGLIEKLFRFLFESRIIKKIKSIAQ